jgi:hypothetical protein
MTTSHIVAGGGWRGTRLDRVKVKACIALTLAIILLIVSVASIGTVLFYASIPAVISLIVSVVLFIRERPVEVESLTGRAGTDPRKLYGWALMSESQPRVQTMPTSCKWQRTTSSLVEENEKQTSDRKEGKTKEKTRERAEDGHSPLCTISKQC